MTDSRKLFSSTVVFFIAAAGVVITLWGMQQAAATINALILGAIIVASFTPLMHWMQRKGVPDIAAYVITLVAIFVVFAGLLALQLFFLSFWTFDLFSLILGCLFLSGRHVGLKNQLGLLYFECLNFSSICCCLLEGRYFIFAQFSRLLRSISRLKLIHGQVLCRFLWHIWL